MRLLLDTHVILWDFGLGKGLPGRVIQTMDHPENEVFVSMGSLWEIAIKINAGKLDVDFETLLSNIAVANFKVLQVENAHLQKLIKLPKIHKDPFDRLLVATAQAEGAVLLTADENIQQYDVNWLW